MTMGSHAADHHSRSGGMTIRRSQRCVADGAYKAVGVEVQMQSRNSNEGLWAHGPPAERAGEVGICRAH